MLEERFPAGRPIDTVIIDLALSAPVRVLANLSPTTNETPSKGAGVGQILLVRVSPAHGDEPQEAVLATAPELSHDATSLAGEGIMESAMVLLPRAAREEAGPAEYRRRNP